jgi:hypothetical protein
MTIDDTSLRNGTMPILLSTVGFRVRERDLSTF